MLNWKGDVVARNTGKAAILAVDATMSACVINARTNHSPGARGARRFESHTGELERGTKIVAPAKVDARGVVGRWGVANVIYARRIELGFQGKDKLGRAFNQPAYPYLRPAAEKEYPKLSRRIKLALERQKGNKTKDV